jgi:Na+/H+ antiporter NhaD/arsenite permease-like protein
MPTPLISTKGGAFFPFLKRPRIAFQTYKRGFAVHFPTFYTAFPRLPFALIPFAFSQFILIEGLAHQGWIEIFAKWLVEATGRKMYPTIWLVGVLGVILCNLSGTNIGATILLTKVVRAASTSAPAGTDVTAFDRAAAIALAVASNIGAVSFTFSASLAGLLWKQILNQKGIFIKQKTFAWWNIIPLAVMTTVGLAVVCAEMAVLF